MADYQTTPEKEPFSYDEDIQPLMSNYFSTIQNSGLSGSTQIRQLESEKNKLQVSAARDMELKQRAQQFEITRLQLEEARRKSASTFGRNESLDSLGQQLTMAITKAPEQDRDKIIGTLGVQFAPLIANNDTAKTMFDSAQRSRTNSSVKNTDDKIVEGVLGDLNSVKMGEDLASRPLNEFKDEVSAGKVADVIDLFGTPEEKQMANDSSPLDKFNIARTIRNNYIKSKLQKGTTVANQGPRSLFSKKSEVSYP